MALLSPGVEIIEIDASTIVPTVSNSIGVYCGDFDKGPVGTYLLITSVEELISFYGKPSNLNYNDWYQAYNFLQYGNKLLIARAANTNGSAEEIAGLSVTDDTAEGETVIEVTGSTLGIEIGDKIVFGDSEGTLTEVYSVISVITDTSFEISHGLKDEIVIVDDAKVYKWDQSMNSVFEAVDDQAPGEAVGVTNTNTLDAALIVTDDVASGETDIAITGSTSGFEVGDSIRFASDDNVYTVAAIVDDTSITLLTGLTTDIVVLTSDEVFSVVTTVDNFEYIDKMMVIENASDWEMKESSIAFTNATDSKLKFIGRNPGNWSNGLEICIATPDLFTSITDVAYAFDGIALIELFEYAPTGTEVGIVIKMGDDIVETFTVDFNVDAKDHNNKSTYIETVINNNSSYVFVKDNTGNTDSIKDYIYSTIAVNGGIETLGVVGKLVMGVDSVIQNDDLLTAYELFDNKEELDIDIIIANELDGGVSAKNLAETRKDCIAFIGATYADTVGKKSAVAVSNLVTWRKTGDLKFNSMFLVASANYKYIYDRYNDKNRWVNIAGDIAGLRAQTSTNRASWYASAGLERGQIKNVTKLAFNPNNGQRDILYKNGLNPVVAFPGQGTVMWGQKTLLDKPSSFDRVNVRGLFNTMERALGKMAKYQVMEFNDNFTRNRIISMIKPYLSSVKAGRGVQDFLVICDESNNTPDVISRNNLVVDIYIKPTYVAEFIQLRFTNAGTNSFSEVIGG